MLQKSSKMVWSTLFTGFMMCNILKHYKKYLHCRGNLILSLSLENSIKDYWLHKLIFPDLSRSASFWKCLRYAGLWDAHTAQITHHRNHKPINLHSQTLRSQLIIGCLCLSNPSYLVNNRTNFRTSLTKCWILSATETSFKLIDVGHWPRPGG